MSAEATKTRTLRPLADGRLVSIQTALDGGDTGYNAPTIAEVRSLVEEVLAYRAAREGSVELQRKGFRLGMQEAAAMVRRQDVSGMPPIDPALARKNFAQVIDARAAACESFFERTPASSKEPQP